jgi:4-oxalocrotonate tautomerase
MGIERHTELLNVWSTYRDSIYQGDADALARIFHPDASMFYVLDGRITVTPIGKYIEVVRNRVAPVKSGAKRDERLVSLGIPSVDSAVLTATILILGKSFTDQLVMLKVNGAWQIVAKTYHLDSDS